MRNVNLDNLEEPRALAAFAKARAERPWVTSAGKDRFRVRARRRDQRRPDERRINFVTFTFAAGLRLATCTCLWNKFQAQRGKLCYHVAAAYLRLMINRKRAKNRARKMKLAA